MIAAHSPMPSPRVLVTGPAWLPHAVVRLTLPDLRVPAGFTSDPPLPVALSFLGPAFSDAKLLAYGHAFEQALAVRRLPVTTPPLPGERFEY